MTNSLSENVFLANKSGSNDPQADSSQSVPASHASGASAKSCTTSLNGVAVARSGNTNSKSKKPTKKSQVVEISDPEDDDSLERNAALASPAKGAESCKATKVCKSLYMFIICIKKYHEGHQGGKQVISKSDAHPCQPAQDYQENCSSVLHCYLHG